MCPNKLSSYATVTNRIRVMPFSLIYISTKQTCATYSASSSIALESNNIGGNKIINQMIVVSILIID